MRRPAALLAAALIVAPAAPADAQRLEPAARKVLAMVDVLADFRCDAMRRDEMEAIARRAGYAGLADFQARHIELYREVRRLIVPDERVRDAWCRKIKVEIEVAR